MNTEVTTSNERALELQRVEIDTQIATAKRYPRDLVLFEDRCKQMISTPEMAAGCNYYLTKGGKSIKGPSIRMAEIIQNNWGNMRTSAKVMNEEEKFITVVGACHDLETNVAVQVEVKRRITTSKGARYGADMIQTTIAAGISIAMRNAIFKIVPNIYTKQLAAHAEKVAAGPDNKFPDMVKSWILYFVNLGISEDAILAKLKIEKKSQISKAHIHILQGIGTALNENMTTLEVEFPSPLKEPEAGEEKAPAGQMSDNELITGK